ncbi:hypothetical protein MAR_003812 [Mya arenaria]|uniref:Uncharacterized protein n=1 Tax=Mya arenaria TaxID=6604 RepID=A0ABY7EXX7_MYAAR|nr:hypothetical protein MAR_003812 [Mya arenaria]
MAEDVMRETVFCDAFFPVPGDCDILENLEMLQLQDLSPRFQAVAATFMPYIYSRGPKQLEVSKPVNGSKRKNSSLHLTNVGRDKHSISLHCLPHYTGKTDNNRRKRIENMVRGINVKKIFRKEEE